MTATEAHEAARQRRDAAEKALYAARQAAFAAQQEFDAAREEVRQTAFVAWMERDRAEKPTPDHGEEHVDEGRQTRTLRYLHTVTKGGTLRIAAEVRKPTRMPDSWINEEIRRTRGDYAAMKMKWGAP